ncbi:MAG TPA: HlyD family secretion protein [Bryobacteraceae bacterium]|nr:HlyD family secretion protein [Bryobacteraceae bacterium]
MTPEEVKKAPTPRPTPVPEKLPEPSRGRAPAIVVLVLVLAVIATGGVLYWNYAQTYEDTDDAQIDAHLNSISARIAGTVTAIHAEENQLVKAGQLVAELDPSDYSVAFEQARAEMLQKQAEVGVQNPSVPIVENANETGIDAARADVANVEASVAWAESDAAAARAKLREAEANAAKAQADVARYKALVDKDEIPRQVYDQAVANAAALSAAVDSARATAEAGQKSVEQRRAQLSETEAKLMELGMNAPHEVAIRRATVVAKQADANVAKTRVELARLNLSYTKITAPVAGIVSKRNVEIGNHVQPGQQLFLIAQTDDLWVTANFKETQLRRIHPGQKATISVDAYGQELSGYVESFPAATGTITSLLPPENASGNYVKVVQRLPVRIRFNKNQTGLDRLRPGMSVEPKIWIK